MPRPFQYPHKCGIIVDQRLRPAHILYHHDTLIIETDDRKYSTAYRLPQDEETFNNDLYNGVVVF